MTHENRMAWLRGLPGESVDAVLTEPPPRYNESDLENVFQEVNRVLKPGGHALVWTPTRKGHRVALMLENSGMEVRDCIHHLRGRQRDAETFYASLTEGQKGMLGDLTHLVPNDQTVTIELGWLARKPIEQATVAEQMMATGTGAINIEGCRIEFQGDTDRQKATPGRTVSKKGHLAGSVAGLGLETQDFVYEAPTGRWPANLTLDRGEPGRILGEQSGDRKPGGTVMTPTQGYAGKSYMSGGRGHVGTVGYEDSGTAARYFQEFHSVDDRMAYFARLITPPGGTLLDPFSTP